MSALSFNMLLGSKHGKLEYYDKTGCRKSLLLKLLNAVKDLYMMIIFRFFAIAHNDTK